MLIRLILAAFCATAATAQTLDTVVRFPYEVRELFHVPGGNKLYVTAFVRDSSTNHIYILDCATMAVRRQIPTGKSSTDGDHRAAWCPPHDKVYMGLGRNGYPDTAGLAVIDNATDSVVRRLPVGVHYGGIAYSSTSDKLYTATQGPSQGGTITAVDCAADTVLKTIALPDYWPGFFAVWDSEGEKAYFGGGGWSNGNRVTVVDCRTDTVVAVIRARVTYPCVAAYNPLRRKLYVGAEAAFGVSVIDCATDSVISRFDSIWSDDDRVPVYCSAEDKVYWPVFAVSYPTKPDTINVIDCASDSVIRRIPAPGGYTVNYCAYAPWNNRLYVVSNCYLPTSNLLTVYDCHNDSIIGQTRFGVSAREIVCNPVDHRIYVSDYWDSAVYVFREDLQPVAEEPELESGGLAARVWPNPARDCLWVGGPGPLILYSASGQRLLALVPGRNLLPQSLAAGVYFVRPEPSAASRQPSAVTKVVLTE
jgi:DNA-binding beta-propeller fold protein YncE